MANDSPAQLLPNDTPLRRHTFRRRHRLSGERAFRTVYQARCRKNAGPLSVHGKPNGLKHLRLGLSIGRRVGNSVYRNRIKRLLRESFRMLQHDWPASYDIVIVVHPHQTLTLAEYQRLLFRGIKGQHTEWQKRQKKSAPTAKSQ